MRVPTPKQIIEIAKELKITVEKRFFLVADGKVVNNRMLFSVYGVNYPIQFSGFCDKEESVVIEKAKFMHDAIWKGTGREVPLGAAPGYRVLKDGIGLGSKYDFGVAAKEVYSFPEELHQPAPVIFLSQKEALDVTKRLITYAAQVILIRGKWNGYNNKQRIKEILGQ